MTLSKGAGLRVSVILGKQGAHLCIVLGVRHRTLGFLDQFSGIIIFQMCGLLSQSEVQCICDNGYLGSRPTRLDICASCCPHHAVYVQAHGIKRRLESPFRHVSRKPESVNEKLAKNGARVHYLAASCWQ